MSSGTCSRQRSPAAARPARRRSAGTGLAGATIATVSPGLRRAGAMDSFTDWLIGFASDRNHPAGYALLAGSALLEYVFPPFPGDTITLFGAVLITAYGWSGAGVFATVLAGSLAGAMIDFAVGRRLRARGHKRPAVDRIVARFERH